MKLVAAIVLEISYDAKKKRILILAVIHLMNPNLNIIQLKT